MFHSVPCLLPTRPWLGVVHGPRSWDWVSATVGKALELVFEGGLGPDGARVLAVLRRAGAAFRLMRRDPVGFLANLVATAKRGFTQFLGKAPHYLQQGLAGWLLGTLAQTGLQLPAKLDVPGMLALALQAVGATYPRLWAKLVRASSEAVVAGLEHSFGFLQTLMTKGVGAAWVQLQDSLGDVRAQVLGGVQAWVERTLLTQAILKLVALFNPAGAVLQALQFTYNTVSFFLDNGQQIGAVVETYLNALGPIAEGKIGAAANAVEGALGRTVPLVLSFLAGHLGLNQVPEVLQAQLQKVRVPLDKALDRLVAWLLKQGGKVIAVTKDGGRQVVDTVRGWLGLRESFKVGAEQHTLFFQGSGASAKLRVASKPQNYDEFLASVPDTPALASTKKAAQELAQRLDARLQKHPISDFAPDITLQVEKELRVLAQLTVRLMRAQATPVVADSDPVFSGLSSGGFGKGMRMEYLTSRTTGTDASARGNDVYLQLNQRRNGAGSYYERGHLLSAELHGSGSDWQNLTPLSRSGNGLHVTQVESLLKDAIGGPTPRAFLYTVMPVYGRGVQTGLLSQTTHDPAGKIKAEIIRAEQHVPLSLVCTFQEVDPAEVHPHTRKPVGKVQVITVPNIIEQNSLDDYQTQMKLPSVDINTNVDVDPLLQLNIPSKQANAIVEKVDQDKVFFRNREHLMNEVKGLNRSLIDTLYEKGQIRFK